MFSKTALRILEKRYFLRDKDGNQIEKTPEELFRRVAKYISSAENNYKQEDANLMEESFYDCMINQEIMPASPILFNAGTENPMLSSCFGIEVNDNMESILKVLCDSAMIFKKGGGVGWNFSKLRSKGSRLSSGGSSSGVCSFIDLYDTMIETIKQGGRRRGAGAVILDACHPDILEFIRAKTEENRWNNINISVICTDDFMSKIDTQYKAIWDELINANWRTGDPNVIFIDTMNRNNSLPKYPINCVNPCHEICMSSYESCNLAGINLDKCLKGNKRNLKIDWDKLGKLVKIGHRFLDDMIDVCEYPLPEISNFALRTRRQGLYVFGLAPVLLKLGLRYGSQESIDLIDNLFCFINRVSLESCIELGKIRGNFPDFQDSTYVKKYKYMRCSNRLTIAPSGTTSRIADSYFSIEPYYAFDFVSNIMDEKIEEKITLKDEYKDLYPEAIITAHEIKPEEHIRVMSTIQKWVDQSISKTINLPFDTNKDEISQIFKLAFSMGLKCITTFRDGCKGSQVLETKEYKDSKRKIYSRTYIDKNILEDLYNTKKYSQSQIAELLGVSRGVIVTRMKEYSIEPRQSCGTSRHIFVPQYETIKSLHNKGLNLDEIAEIFDHEKTFIQEIIEKCGGLENGIMESSVPLTPQLIEFMEGELLGDGCIMPVQKSPNTKMAYYAHSSKYKEYLEWLDSIFSSEGLYMSGRIYKEPEGSYHYRTSSCVELMTLRKRWYPNDVKIVPDNLILTPVMVRQWFIGDGTLKNEGVALCTNGFDEKSLDLLTIKLKEIGFSATIWSDKRLYINQAQSPDFFNYVNSSFYVDAPCYEYKFKASEPNECRNGLCEI